MDDQRQGLQDRRAGARRHVGMERRVGKAERRNLSNRFFEALDSRVRAAAGNTQWRDVDQRHGFQTQAVPNIDSRGGQDGLLLEQKVWALKGYGNAVKDYAAYDRQALMYTTTWDGRTVGVVRIFKGTPERPPFLDLPVSNAGLIERLSAGCKSGLVEELATIAVEDAVPMERVSNSLWRMSYRHALERGTRVWGVIMEPARVATLNRRYGFGFQQIGPTREYQGGQCAAHIMDLESLRRNLPQAGPRTRKRLHYFVEGPLQNQWSEVAVQRPDSQVFSSLSKEPASWPRI